MITSRLLRVPVALALAFSAAACDPGSSEPPSNARREPSGSTASPSEPPEPPEPAMPLAQEEKSVDACLTSSGPEPLPVPPGASRREIVDKIAFDVERMRELEFSGDVESEFVSSKTLAEKVRGGIGESFDEDENDAIQRLGEILGFVEPGKSFEKEVKKAASEGVIGLYDPKEEKLFVEAQGGELSMLEILTLVHELEHAIADQALGFPRGGNEDAVTAHQSVIEGDASLLQMRYMLAGMGDLQRDAVVSTLREQGMFGAVPDDQSYFLQRTLQFPYEWGLAFMCRLYARRGWDAIDRAYRNPPTTTAQVMYRGRYERRESAADPRHRNLLGDPWEREATITVGAADLWLLFEAPGNEPERGLSDALGRAEAWAGGEVVEWIDGPKTAVLMSLVEHREGSDLCESMSEWYAAAFDDARRVDISGGEGFVRPKAAAALACRDRRISMGFAPKLKTARALVR